MEKILKNNKEGANEEEVKDQISSDVRPISGGDGVGESDPFRRSKALARTPPTNAKAGDLSLRDEDDGGVGKGKRDEKPPLQLLPAWDRLRRSPLKKRTGSFSEVEKIISFGNGRDGKKRRRSQEEEEEGKKTKRSNKNILQMLKKAVMELKEELENEILKTSKMEDLMTEVCNLTERAIVEDTIRSETQKNGSQGTPKSIDVGKIQEVETYRQFKLIAEKRWTKECYARTKIKAGPFPLDEGDIIFLRNEKDPNMEEGVARRLKERIPEVSNMKEPGWETLIINSRKISRKTDNGSWERQIHVGDLREGEELYKEITELMQHMERDGRTKGVLPLDKGDPNPELVAKMIECIFKSTEINIDIYSLGGERTEENIKKFQNNAILVETTKANYADTLRKVKSNIGKYGKQVELKKIRSTRDGNMIIELKEGDTGEEIQKAIKGDQNMKVKILDKNRIKGQRFIMRDLDALTTAEEVVKSLKETAVGREENETIKLISLRSAPGETQVAIVQLHKKHSERLNEVGGVRMGALKIRPKEWFTVGRCYRCWDYGHKANECTGPDRKDACLRCGKKEGHTAKECKNMVYCPICAREGHKAGSGACPKMRSILDRLRKQEGDRKRGSRK